MFNEKRELMFNQYNRARNYFIQNPNQLIEVEHHIVNLVNHTIAYNLEEIKKIITKRLTFIHFGLSINR